MGGETLCVTTDEDGSRLDRWLRRRWPALTQGRVEKLLRGGQIRVEGKRVKSNHRLAAGEAVRLPPEAVLLGPVAGTLPPGEEEEREDARADTPAPRPVVVRDADVALLRRSILHQDDQLVVLNKPAGLAVQGGTGTDRHLDAMLAALAEAMGWTTPGRGGEDRSLRLVHRLDKDTSGVLVLARGPAAARALTAAFRARETAKIYWALVVGVPPLPQGTIRAALAKQPGSRGERMGVDEGGGRSAVTDYRVVDTVGRACAWLDLKPRTGRTHQLRVHCLEMGTPILGDGKYGARGAFLEGVDLPRRLHLHARALALPHPAGGLLQVVAPPPPHFTDSLRALNLALSTAGDPFAGWGDEG